MIDWRKHIGTNPEILAGKPIINGTRLSVEFILGRLADGWSQEEVLENVPGLQLEDILAVHAYAYDCLKGGLLYPISDGQRA